MVKVNYRSIDDASNAVWRLMGKVKQRPTVIVGVPRSGLMFANMMALNLNIPVTDVDGFVSGRLIRPGLTGRSMVGVSENAWRENVFVLDDSVYSGNQMESARSQIDLHRGSSNVEYGCLYVTPDSVNKVEYYAEVVEWPRVFEWNIYRHSLLSNSCVDIDGILCRDPSDDENDDGEKYTNFLRSVEPLVIPATPIGTLVTCRLERYRSATEEWLKRHNVIYHKLEMLNLPDQATRQRLNCYAEFKSSVYKELDAILFLESSVVQAEKIAALSGKPVFCQETRRLVQPQEADEKFLKWKQSLICNFMKRVTPIKWRIMLRSVLQRRYR